MRTEKFMALQTLAKEESYRMGNAGLLTQATAIVTFATGILWHPWWWSVAAGVVAYVVSKPVYTYFIVRRWQQEMRKKYADLGL